ncbi:lytic transglycosylase domain-containing protein [Paraburkholderia tropica]|uniref:lytic transglycosylase domain-containing protein n=1 Tax=Paraburkholderia tropica TaxID=92647 RepID=UPI002AB65B03|nr:lytic transglycosylase domain-containing protein [Paraburkholderia tropica]
MIPLAAFVVLAQQCAPDVAPATMAAVVRVESDFNPYAIGVVHGRLQRQPASLAEAVATARALDAAGWNYSAGLAQVNRSNWPRFGLTADTAFDPCRNLAAGAAILQGCFERARRIHAQAQEALRSGLSCYASGDFSTGYRTGYVQRVVVHVAHVADTTRIVPVVPAIDPHADPQADPQAGLRTLAIPVEAVTSPVPPATGAPGARPDAASSRPGNGQVGRSDGQPEGAAQESAVVF